PIATRVVCAPAAALQSNDATIRSAAGKLKFLCIGEPAAGETARDSLLQIARRHRHAENVDAFAVLDVADEAVFIFQLIVFERRRFGAPGLDARPDEMRAVVSQGALNGGFQFLDGGRSLRG